MCSEKLLLQWIVYKTEAYYKTTEINSMWIFICSWEIYNIVENRIEMDCQMQGSCRYWGHECAGSPRESSAAPPWWKDQDPGRMPLLPAGQKVIMVTTSPPVPRTDTDDYHGCKTWPRVGPGRGQFLPGSCHRTKASLLDCHWTWSQAEHSSVQNVSAEW